MDFNFIEVRKKAKELILNKEFEKVYKNFDLNLVLPESSFTFDFGFEQTFWESDYFIFQAILENLNLSEIMQKFALKFPDCKFINFLNTLESLMKDNIISIGFDGKMQFLKFPENEWHENDVYQIFESVSDANEEYYQKEIIKSSELLWYMFTQGVSKSKNMKLFYYAKDEIDELYVKSTNVNHGIVAWKPESKFTITRNLSSVLRICMGNGFEEMVDYLYKNYRKDFESSFNEHPQITKEYIELINKMEPDLKLKWISKIDKFRNKKVSIPISLEIKI